MVACLAGLSVLKKVEKRVQSSVERSAESMEKMKADWWAGQLAESEGDWMAGSKALRKVDSTVQRKVDSKRKGITAGLCPFS